ncbi:MAG: PQQ-binding-like beta-propeller repeat protein [Bryobacteraceae bacterium]
MIALAVLLLAAEGDWSRFRGPNGTGVSAARDVPAVFGPEQNVAWKTTVPPGHSSPVLGNRRVFLTAFEGEKLLTLCLDRRTGRVIWRREAPRARSEHLDKRNSPASSTPVTDGRNVWVFFPDFGLLSYDADGKERWRLPLGPFNNLYGMGGSPILVDGLIVLVCDQTRESFAIAVDAASGRVRWRTPRPEALSGHSTPVVYRPPHGPAHILAPGSFRMDAYSVENGEAAWWVRGLASEMKSVPVVDGDRVYINGYNLPENDPGRQIQVPPFSEVAAKHDADGDGRLSREESPDPRVRSAFVYLDLDHNGQLDAAEWKTYAAALAAENALIAFRIGGRGDVGENNLVWKYQRGVSQLPSTLLYREVLYMLNDAGVLTTFDAATGAVHRQARVRAVSDRYYASPVAAGGRVYIAAHSGVVTVLNAGPAQEQIASNDLGEEIWATPALAAGRVWVRTRAALYCFGK